MSYVVLKGTVYLIHLDRKLGDPDNPLGQAQHYLGWAYCIDQRLHQHRTGKGSPMLRYANENGIGWNIVRKWPGETRATEARLKRLHNTPKLCPICQRKKVTMDPNKPAIMCFASQEEAEAEAARRYWLYKSEVEHDDAMAKFGYDLWYISAESEDGRRRNLCDDGQLR